MFRHLAVSRRTIGFFLFHIRIRTSHYEAVIGYLGCERIIIAKRPNPYRHPMHCPAAKRPAMLDELALDLPPGVDEVRGYLGTMYKKATLLLGLVGSGISSSGHQHAIEKIFVNLATLNGAKLDCEFRDVVYGGSSAAWDRSIARQQNRAKPSKQSIHLSALFSTAKAMHAEETSGSTRILVLASGGCGKTTMFLKQAPRLWAMGELWPQFTILVAREFRSPAVQGANDALDLLGLGTFAVDPECKRTLNKYILNCPERICLILDGLDEASLPNCTGFVGDVVRGTALCGICLVVTSRPSQEALELNSSKPFNSTVEVTGFQPEQVREYVNTVMVEDEKMQVLHALDSHPQLGSLVMMPFYSRSVCELVAAGYPVPKCQTDVVDSLVLAAVSRMRGKHISSWEMLQNSDKELVNRIGCFAMHTLFHRQLIFSDADTTEHHISAAAKQLGLLVQCEVTPQDTSTQFRFSHLIMQEGLASRFVASCNYLSNNMLTWVVEQLGADTVRLTTFWTFLAALIDHAKVEALVGAFLLTARKKVRKDGMDAVTSHFFISPTQLEDIQKYLMEFLSQPDMEELARQLLVGLVKDDDPANAVNARISQHPGTPTDEFLTELLLLWQQLTPHANASMIVEALHTVNPATGRRFSRRFLPQVSTVVSKKSKTATAASTPSATGQPSPHVEKLNLSFQRSRGILLLVARCFAERALRLGDNCKPVGGLGSALEAHGLDVSRCICSPLDCLALGIVLRFHRSSVRAVRLSGCAIGDDGLCMLKPGLLTCDSLEEMDWTKNKLTQASMPTLATAVRNSCGNLEAMSLASNRIGASGNAESLQGLSTCTKLTKLNLGSCGLDISNMPAVNDVLAACSSTLEEVDLSTPAIGDDCFGLIYRGLALCTKLTSLSIRGSTEVTAKSGAALSIVLGSCLQLRQAGAVKVRLTRTAGVVQLVRNLHSPPNTTEKLVLSYRALTSECCAILNDVLLSQFGSLTELSLWSNSIDDDGLRVISESLCRCSRMVDFKMSYNDLTASSLPAATALLRHWTGIEEVCLGGQRKTDTPSELPVEQQHDFIATLEQCLHLKFVSVPRHWVCHGGAELPGLQRHGLKVSLWDC